MPLFCSEGGEPFFLLCEKLRRNERSETVPVVATIPKNLVDHRNVSPIRLFGRCQRLLIRGEDRLRIRGGRGGDRRLARHAAGEGQTQARDEQGRDRRRGGGPSRHAATLGQRTRPAGAPSTATARIKEIVP